MQTMGIRLFVISNTPCFLKIHATSYLELTFQGRDVVAPEFGLVGEAGVLGIKIEMHFA